MGTKFVNMLNQVMTDPTANDLIHNHTEDEALNGRTIKLDGQTLVNFGSCSYLGLEKHPALEKGCIDAVRKFGTQFSSSRTYASLSLYDELETGLRSMFGKPVVVSASTTLGHLATMPTVVGDNDAVILDMQVHSSMQMSAQLLRAEGIPITIIRHNDMEALEKKLTELQKSHDRVWYFADGVYSMYGDYAPLDSLQELLEKYPKFYVYIDDAHGMSWAGKNGIGYVRSQMEHHPKMILAVSLNKSFAAAGGAIVFPNQEMADKVRNCGGTMIFSGPIQPPMLGVACAATRIHQSDEIVDLQHALAKRVAHCNASLAAFGLPQFAVTDSPLFFIPVGLPHISYKIIRKMKHQGFFVNVAAFPATPMKRSGIRFMVNLNLTKADISAMVEALATVYLETLQEAGSHPDKVARSFRIPSFAPKVPQIAAQQQHNGLQVEVKASISDIVPQIWDQRMAGRGNFNAASLHMIEEIFARSKEPENQWDFHYVTIRGAQGQVVLNTFYTTALIKEDMFSSSKVSEQIEARRKSAPHYLTTKSVVLGSLITKGEHLFLDRRHPNWKAALQLLVNEMQATMEIEDAGQMLLREFVGEQDPELRNAFLEMGLIRQDLPNICTIEDMAWNSKEEYIDFLSSRYRSDLRREVLRHESKFSMTTAKPTDRETLQTCYDLYLSVFHKSYRINVFQLPYAFFEAMVAHQDFEVIRLYLNDPSTPSHGKLVAVMFSHVGQKMYSAMIVGLDYEVLKSHGVYKQVLYRTVLQARKRGCQKLDLAYTAESVKKKVGARPVAATAYMQVTDHFNQALIASMDTGGGK